MNSQLRFRLKYEYDAQQPGVTIPLMLRFDDGRVPCDARLDTGAQICLFQRELGELLGLNIEAGHRLKVETLAGSLVVFGHSVTLETFGIELDSIVYFSERYGLPRNLLGREGWLQKIRLAIIDYDSTLFLSRYED